MYNVCTLTRFLTLNHYVFRLITRQQIFTSNARLRTERSAKIRAPTVKVQFRLTVWRRCGAEGQSKGNLLFWHCSSLSGNFVFHLRWFFENRLLAAQIAQIPHCAAVVMLDTPCFDVAWDYWLPTPFAIFPFTSPPVRHCVPSGFNWTLLQVWINIWNWEMIVYSTIEFTWCRSSVVRLPCN